MRHQANKCFIAGTCVLFSLLSFARASVTINYEVAEITSAGSNISVGTLLLISHGADNALQSFGWAADSNNFILGDDKLFATVGISNGVAAGALSDISVPTGTVNTTTKFTGLFIAGITSTELDYATGILNGSRKFTSSGGTVYQYGTYRTDSIESFGSAPDGNMAWVFPAEGATMGLSAYSNTGDYTGASITASLATASSFAVIPEPSVCSMLALGTLMFLRRRKIS